MRGLLTMLLVAVAAVAAVEAARADKHKGIAASKEEGSRRPDSAKEQNSDRSGEKCPKRDSESERRLKEEMEREDERATSRRYGKSLRASAAEGLPFAPPAAQPSVRTEGNEPLQSAELPGPMGGILLALRSLWSRYLFHSHSALAAPRMSR